MLQHVFISEITFSNPYKDVSVMFFKYCFFNACFFSLNVLFCVNLPAGMCNPRNYSDTPPTSKSTVEELHEPIPSLFRALTEGDTQLNWNIVSFPVTEELSHHENLVSFLESVNPPQHQNVSVPNNNVHISYSNDKGNATEVTFVNLCLCDSHVGF